ncbi:MAG: ATP-binding protein [Coprothermobacterota bacterium]|nr:ATP-binding protein [Coprothermobacterota bacterium]
MFQRTIAQQISDGLGKPNTALILYGPRQAGKTTMVKQLLQDIPNTIVFIGDDLYTQSLLARHELENLKRIVGSATTIFIDEAQRIENIGLTIKLLVDHLPVTIIASGSASFELANRLSEPLTGRARTFHLHPLSWEETAAKYRMIDPESALEEMLRFGMYPRVHTLESNQEKEEYLYSYINSYLYRDLLEFEQIKKPRKVVDLLTLLAHQIGKEVAVSELSNALGLTQKTVENYLDILEKMFVLVNIRGFSRNLRKEVTKTSRYYFIDVGVRNALIRSFVPLSVRSDAGELFENWFVMERIKRAGNQRRFTGFYFWRTYDQHEVDLVEDLDGRLIGFECKWSPKSIAKAPKDWLQSYPDAGFEVVSRGNWRGYLEAP